MYAKLIVILHNMNCLSYTNVKNVLDKMERMFYNIKEGNKYSVCEVKDMAENEMLEKMKLIKEILEIVKEIAECEKGSED